MNIIEKITIYFGILYIVFAMIFTSSYSFAEQSGNTPDSGTDSTVVDIYNDLVSLNFGNEEAGSWGNLGNIWNRIWSSSLWVPDADMTAADVYPGKTFYNGSRVLQTGTAVIGRYEQQGLQDYLDTKCTNNNGESNSACDAGQSEYIGEETEWIKTAEGGNPVSVTDNGITATISSNSVYRDSLTKLYWSDVSATILDSQWRWIDGSDLVNPTDTTCNFASEGDANQYCDNTYVLTGSPDNDVSNAEFCLNLALDADNADNDNNGATGVETDWRLPSIFEFFQAIIDGAYNNLPNQDVLIVTLGRPYYKYGFDGVTYSTVIDLQINARCVRSD